MNKEDFPKKVWDGIIGHLGPIYCKDYSLIDVSPGYAKVSLKTDPDTKNNYGFTHGGVFFTLCDLVSGIAVYAYGVKNVTLQANINYIKPGTGDIIFAEGKVFHKGKTTAVTKVEVTDHEGTLLAIGTYTMYITGKV